jgi:DNA-binding XRE family transcriptional regulator
MDHRQRLTHIERPMTKEEREQAATIREGARKDFPPKETPERPIPPGIPRRIHDARKERGVTRYELGKIAGVPSTAVRAIEEGDDVPMSQFRAVAAALGLTIELVEQT